MYDIYSFSDPYILNKVFNSIALIFNDGVYLTIAASVILLGYLFASFKSLGNGAKEIPIIPVLVAIILFSMGFKTKTTVLIHNRFTSQITHVDNIPLAIAYPAHFISRLGKVLLQKYETAFNVQDEQKISQHGFLTPMKMLAELRSDTVILRAKSTSLSNINNINFDRSMRQYTTDCTAIKGVSTSTVGSLREEDITAAIKFDSSAHSTTIYRVGSETAYTCKEAFDILRPLIVIASERVAAITLQHQSYNLIKENNTVDNALNVNAKITQYLKAVDHDYTNNRGFTQSLLLSSYLDDGMLAYYSSLGASDLHENISSSIAQRNQVWITQGELWSDIVFDILSILESTIYSLTPFIGLGLLLGSFGLKMFVVYIQIIAIIHIFPILMTMTSTLLYEEINIFSRMLVLKFDSGSLAYMENLTAKAYELMAYGGMISSTLLPVIAMALVTGSAMGLGSALKGLSSAAPKDTDAVPQTVSQQSAITDQGINKSQTYMSEIGGVSKGTESKMPSILEGVSLSNSTASSKGKMNAADLAYESAKTQAQAEIKSNSFTNSDVSSIGSSVMKGESQRASLVRDLVNDNTKGQNFSEQDKSMIAGMAALSIGTSASAGFNSGLFGKLMTEAKAQGSLTTQGVSGTSRDITSTISDISRMAQSDGFSDEYQKASKSDLSNNQSLTNDNTYSDRLEQRVSTAYKESQSAKAEYKEAAQFEKEWSAKSPQELLPWLSTKYDKDNEHQANSYIESLNGSDKEVFYKNLNNINNNDNFNDPRMAQFTAAMITASSLNDDDALLSMVSGNSFNGIQDTTGVGTENQNRVGNVNIGSPSNSDIPSKELLDERHKQSSTSLKNDMDNNQTHDVRGATIKEQSDTDRNNILPKVNAHPSNVIDSQNAKNAAASTVNPLASLAGGAYDSIVSTVESLKDISVDQKDKDEAFKNIPKLKTYGD